MAEPLFNTDPRQEQPLFNADPRENVPLFDSDPREDEGSFLGDVGDTALWLVRPFMFVGSAGAAPLAHDYESESLLGLAVEGLQVAGNAAMNDLFPDHGSEIPHYMGKALENVDMPAFIRPSVELTASLLTDPTFTVSGGFAKSLARSFELAIRTGNFDNAYVRALKEFVSVVPMSHIERAHYTSTAAKADAGDLNATQEMLDEFVLLDRQKKSIDKTAEDIAVESRVVGETPPVPHPAQALESNATAKEIEQVVDNIKAKNPETLKNASELEDIDKIRLRARSNVMDTVREERAAEVKSIAKASNKDAKKIISENPIYSLIARIKENGGISPLGLPKEIVKALKTNHGIIRNDGKSIMEVGAKFGFDDGLAMADSLAHIGSKKGAVKEVANALFKEDVKSAKALGDIDLQGRFIDEELKLMGVKIPKEINALVEKFKANPSKEGADEIVALLEQDSIVLSKSGKPITTKPKSSKIKTVIREQTGQTTASKMVTEEAALKAAWKKAEQVSRVAFREGKKEAALIAKIRHDAYRQAVKNRSLVIKSLSRMKRDMKHQGVPLDFMEQMQAIVGGIIPLGKKYTASAPSKGFDEWLSLKAAEGDDVFAQAMKVMVDDLPLHRELKDMTPDDLRKFAQFTKSMAHAGVTEGKFLALKGEMTLAEGLAEGISTIQSAWGARFEIPKSIELLEARNRIEKAFTDTNDLRKTLLARNVRPKFIAIALDGEKLDGIMSRLLERPLLEAQRRESIMLDEYKTLIDKIFKPFGKNTGNFNKWKREKTSFTLESGEVRIFDKETQVMVAVNAGNRGNLEALMHGYKLTEKDVAMITSKLSKEESKLVSDIWGVAKSFYEESNKITMKLMNKRLENIENYFPIVEDSRLITKSGGRSKVKSLFDGSEERDLFSTFQRKSTNTKGSQRIARKGGSGALRLKFDVLQSHVTNSIHDVTHALPVRDVQKVLANKEMKDAIHNALGPNAHSQLVTSLQHVARPIREGMSIAERAAGQAKSLTTTAILGLNFAVGLKQTLSLTLAVREIGFTPVAKEVLSLWTNPAEFKRIMAEVDSIEPLIKFRGSSMDRELRDVTTLMVPDKYRDMFFSWIRFNDRMAVYPTYMAAFKKEMKLSGDFEKARRVAMDIVEITQPTNFAKDLAATMRGSEYEKSFKSFMSFFSVMTNSLNRASRQRVLLRKDGKPLKAAIEAARTYWWLLAVPAYLATSVDKGRPATAKEMVNGMVSMRLAGHPLARILNNAAFGAYDAQLNPTESTLRKLLGAVRDPDAKDIATIAGFFAGVPTKPFIRFGEGMEDLYLGNTTDITAPLLGPDAAPDEYDFIDSGKRF